MVSNGGCGKSPQPFLRTRAVRLARMRKVRRVRGCPMGNPGAGYPPAPADPAGPASEPSCGLPGTLGVPWAALRHPRGGDFCPGSLFGLPLDAIAGAPRLPSSHLAADGSPPLLALLPSAGFPGLLDLGPSRPTFLAPIACTWE